MNEVAVDLFMRGEWVICLLKKQKLGGKKQKAPSPACGRSSPPSEGALWNWLLSVAVCASRGIACFLFG